jgi:glycosyltransferase involved in cell wall biosynthesis
MSNPKHGLWAAGPGMLRKLRRATDSVFCTPCWDEPFGLVAIEAMAGGLPVASFDRGAAREVIAEAGVFAVQNNAAALAEAISLALQIPRDVLHMRVLKLFTRDIWLAGCERVYEQAIGGSVPTIGCLDSYGCPWRFRRQERPAGG